MKHSALPDVGWPSYRKACYREDEDEVASSEPSTMASPSPTKTVASSSCREQQELVFLLRHWNSEPMRRCVSMTIPMLASHVMEDAVFLGLPDLSSLPPGSPHLETFLESQEAEASRLNALQDFWARMCTFFCKRMRLTTTAFVLGIIFVHGYRSSTSTSVDSDSLSRPRGGLIYSANHLFVVALMLSNKYTEDHPYPNSSWSKHFGIPIEQLNRLEQAFLGALGYAMFVGRAEFDRWLLGLNRLCDWAGACHRRMLPQGARTSRLHDGQNGLDGLLEPGMMQVPTKGHQDYGCPVDSGLAIPSRTDPGHQRQL